MPVRTSGPGKPAVLMGGRVPGAGTARPGPPARPRPREDLSSSQPRPYRLCHLTRGSPLGAQSCPPPHRADARPHGAFVGLE